MSEHIGSAINRHRLAKEITLQMLAAETGISKTLLWNIEKGNEVPSEDNLGLIATALGIMIGDLGQEANVEV